MKSIVKAPDNYWLIRIPFQERDDYFLADSGNQDWPGLQPGVKSAHADPAGTVSILLPLPIPVKLDLHSLVLVSENLFSGRTHHIRGLCPRNGRTRSLSGGPKRHADWDAREGVCILEIRTALTGQASRVADLRKHIFSVAIKV